MLAVALSLAYFTKSTTPARLVSWAQTGGKKRTEKQERSRNKWLKRKQTKCPNGKWYSVSRGKCVSKNLCKGGEVTGGRCEGGRFDKKKSRGDWETYGGGKAEKKEEWAKSGGGEEEDKLRRQSGIDWDAPNVWKTPARETEAKKEEPKKASCLRWGTSPKCQPLVCPSGRRDWSNGDCL